MWLWEWVVVCGSVLQTQQSRLIYALSCSCDLTSRAQPEVSLKLERILVLVLFLSNYANNFCYQRDVMLTYRRG